ncbi:PLP-dependent transferase [Xylaria sp. CBS 124048]|nr:PLP-dependent transferase [Xylaria sp. CBS 124048]
MQKKKGINLLRGWPSTSLLPAAALRAASQTALSDPDIWMPGLEYGPDPGYQPLREALARWLRGFYGDVAPASSPTPRGENEGHTTETDRITITGGASQNLACILQSFTDPVHTLAIWIVAPCYFLGCPIFADAGFAGRLYPVPEDEEGVDLDFLERSMRAVESEAGHAPDRLGFKNVGMHRKVYRHVVYCVPTFGNPSGRTMSLARREDVVRLARRHDALLICDDVYDMLQWRTANAPVTTSLPSRDVVDLDKALLPRLVDTDIAEGRSPHDPVGKHFGHAVSNGSFSKLVAPGVRTGWTYSTPDFAYGLSQTGSTRSGGAASQLAATIVCELLSKTTSSAEAWSRIPPDTTTNSRIDEEECQLDYHIRQTLRPSYARRHALLTRTVHAALTPLGIRMQEGSLRGQEDIYGGYFVWLKLPRQSTTTIATGTKTTAWPTAQAIADRCVADENLIIGNGELFAVRNEDAGELRFDNAIRLCFAFENEGDLVEGVERLGRVIRTMLDEEPEEWEVIQKIGVPDMNLTK